MPAYLVTLDGTKSGHTVINGGDAMAVFAADATAAKEICTAKFAGDGASWTTDGTATQIIQDPDFEGWTFKIEILSGFGGGGTNPVTITSVGTSGDNTIDEIGDLLVIACNAVAGIAGSAYNSTTQVLTISDITDAFGDQTVQVTITPPSGESGIASLVGTIVHEGIAAAVLTVVLPADAAVIPIVTGVLKQT